MNCAISREQIERFGAQVAKDLLSNIGTDQPFDLRSYTESIYNKVKEVSNDENRALDYARLVPGLVEQITAFDREIKGNLLSKGFDFNALANLAFQVQEDATGIEAIKEFMALPTERTVVDELADLNDQQAIEGRAEEVAETEVQEVEEQPVVPNTTPPVTRNLAGRIYDRIAQVFKAAPPTALVDRNQEALSYDKNSPDYNVPDPSKKFFFDVKRKILSQLANSDFDSSEMNYQGYGGLYLTAMSVAELPEDYIDQQFKEDIQRFDPDKKGVVLVLTGTTGEPVLFDLEGNVNWSQGKIAYYMLRNTEGVFQADGSVRLKPQDKNSIKAMARLQGISEQAAQEAFIRELKMVDDIRKHVSGTSNKVRSMITGGTFGYVEVDAANRQKIMNINFGDEIFRPIAATRDEQVPGVKTGQTYFQTDGLYGQTIVIERPYVKDTGLVDTIVDLIVEDLVDESGTPIDYATRRNYLDNYIYKKDGRINTGVQRTTEEGDVQRFVKIDGVKFMLTTPEERDAARQALNSYFNEFQLGNVKTEAQLTPNQRILPANAPRETWAVNNAVPVMEEGIHKKNQAGHKLYRVVDMVKLHINKDQLNQSFPKVQIQKNPGGAATLSASQTAYNTFLKEHFYMDEELNAANQLVKLNAHFTFQPIDEDMQKVYGRNTQEEMVQEVEQVTVPTTPLQDENPGGTDMSIDDMIRQGIGDDELHKRFDQKNAETKATLEQIKAARTWYENHPMSKHFPFEEAFHMVNSKDMNSVATWAMHGITLYNGSNYSDLYHEAWHGFTQAFMTKDQKQKLYGEARKKSGSFTDYKGHRVQFSKATDLQLEEYLAEDFRSYMLSGQKVQKDSPVRNSLFRKIWNFLKALFDNSTVQQIATNDKADQFIHDLYEKLRVGNLTEFTFSQENVSFGELNKGINAWDAEEPRQQLSYQQSKEILDTIDALFSEYVDVRNIGLTQEETAEYTRLKALVRDPNATIEEKRNAIPRIEAFELRKSYKYTSAILKSPVHLKLAYTHARNRLAQLYREKEVQYNAETNDLKKPLLKKQMETLHWAFRNFGNLENVKENLTDDASTVKGVIGYHLMKSQFYFDEATALLTDNENMTEDEIFLAGRDGLGDRKGNEHSMRDLASKEILYLIKGLYRVDKAGNVEYNSLGMPKLVKEQEVINRLARVLQNTLRAEEMEQKLIAEAEVYPPIKQLLSRMGPLRTASKTEAQLWTAFWQTFNKSRVHLIQMTLEKATNKETDQVSYISKIGQAFNTTNKIARAWDSEFKTASPESSKYLKRDVEGNYLNIPAVLEDFKTDGNAPEGLKLAGRELDFFRAIGINLTDTPEVRETIKSSEIGADWFLSTLKVLNAAGVKVRSINDITKEYRATLTNPKTGRTYPGPKGLNRRLNKITALEAKYSDAVSNAMVTNAEGNTQFEHTLNNSLTMMVNTINNVSTYDELIKIPHMAHLNVETNPFAKASTWLNSIFDLSIPGGPKRLVDGNPVEITLTNLSGVLIQEEDDTSGEGVASAKADEFTKFILDLHLVTQIGIPELMRHADKGTSYSASISKIFRTKGSKKGSEDRQYIMNRDFLGNNYHEVAFEMINPHIMAEVKRIKEMTTLGKRLQEGEDIGVYDYKYIKRGSTFVQFDDVLTQGTKEKLLVAMDEQEDVETFVNSPEGTDLRKAIQQDLQSYFETQVSNVTKRFNETPFMADSLVNNIIGEGKNAGYGNVTKEQAKDALIKSFVYNSWIHNIESLHLFYGDLALYNHEKEEFHKRNAGMGSTGNLYRTDEVFKDYANTVLGRGYAASLGIESKLYDGTFDTAAVQDNEIGSVYFNDYVQALVNSGMTEADAKSTLKPYDEGGMNEGDGQGWITFDAYRIMKEAEGSWSPAQEKLYQDIVSGKRVDPKLLTQFFPTVKAQYMGPLKTSEGMASNLPVMAFHKFSLFPLIPSVIEGTNLQKLHEKMMREGVDYATFESGSKVGTLTKDGKTDALYSDNKRTISDVTFTKNTIFMEYLKNQLEIAPKSKGNVIFSTQLRKLIEDGLYEQGVALSDKFSSLVTRYENNIKVLTNLKKAQLLREANWSVDANGNPQGKLEDLMKFVKRELTRQDLADHEIDFIQMGRNGQLKYDLSLSLSAEKIEKLLNSLVTKRLVKQKVNGEGLIQVSAAGFESVASTVDRDYTNPTEEQKNKYGSNDLPTYHKKADGTTAAMKVKIALQGDFLNLLELADNEGNRIGSRERLNELIRDEQWLNTGRNREMITMVGVRIPVQGLNSMEFMEVYEFLPAEAGNIIVAASELVAKSGGDFDIDKLTVMMPNITKRVKKAKLTNQFLQTMQEIYPDLDFSRENIEILLDAQKDDSGVYTMTPEDKRVLSILEDNAEIEIEYATGATEKGIQNALINDIKSILELSENFASLIRPNGTDIVQPIAEDLQDDVQEYNPTDVVNGQPRTFTKGGKTKKMISPTRVFEIEYNLYKHASNNVGKQTLGLGAVDNTYNTVFNRIGAYLNPTAGTTTQEYLRLKEKEARKGFKSLTREEQKKINTYHRQTLFLDHNTRDVNGEQAISLSHLYSNGTNVKISDIINQMINGWVDIAKDTWIFNIQGNKEVAPTLLFLIQAGVPVEQAIHFASMPMVREYVREQKLAKSTFAEPLGKAAENPNFFRSKAREVILTNPKYGFNLDPEKASGGRQMKTINEEAINRVNGKLDTTKFRAHIKAAADARRAGQQYAYDDFDRSAFMHFLETENMAAAVRDVKLRMNFDTTKSGTLFEAQNRIFMQEALREDARIPIELVDKILTDSPIGSFYIQPFQLAIWRDLFKLRNHPVINDFILDKIRNDRTSVNNTFGSPETFANEMRNDLINYIFQTSVKEFDISSNRYRGRVIQTEVPRSVRDVQEVVSLKFGAFVKDGVLYVDKAKLKRDYMNKAFTKAEYEELGLAKVNSLAFSTPDEYFHFVYEREHLRSQNPLSKLMGTKEFEPIRQGVLDSKTHAQKEDETDEAYEKRVNRTAYEVYLRNKALDNTHNFWKLFRSKDTFADQFMTLKGQFPELENEFEIVKMLSIGVGKMGMKNLKLNDHFQDGDSLNLLHENIRNLIEGNIESVTDAADKQRISEFFRRFPVVAFLQSGMNTRSAFSMTRLVPQDVFNRVMEKPIKDLDKHLNEFNKPENEKKTSEYLEEFYMQFVSLNNMASRSTSLRGKNYKPELSIDQANAMLKEGKTRAQVTDLGRFFDPLQTLEGNLKGFDPDAIKTSEQAREVLANNPERTYVFNYALDNQSNATSKDYVFSNTGMPNAVGLPTVLAYSGGSANQHITDVDGTINPRVKAEIDAAIESLKEQRDAGQTLVFNRNGYGQYMVNAADTFEPILAPATYVNAEGNTVRRTMSQRIKDAKAEYERLSKTMDPKKLKAVQEKIRMQNADNTYVMDANGRPVMETVTRYYAISPASGSTMPAPQTFLYLSKRLFEEFGFINPNYLSTNTGRGVVQSSQPITDQQVKDFMNHCM